MRIIDLLKADAIELNRAVNSKSEAIDALVALHEKAGNLNDANEYKKAILERESQGTTAIGEGIAVPHAKSESVKTRDCRQLLFPQALIITPPTARIPMYCL